jgi:hypothetical protein
LLDAVGRPPLEVHGSVSLEASSVAADEFPCADLAAFTLLDDEPLLDGSDELRG